MSHRRQRLLEQRPNFFVIRFRLAESRADPGCGACRRPPRKLDDSPRRARIESAVSGPTPFKLSSSSRSLPVGCENNWSSDPPYVLSRNATNVLSRLAFWRKYPEGRIRRSSLPSDTLRMPSTLSNVRGAQVRERKFDVIPRGVLRQIRPDDHFKACFRRPPVLRSPRTIKGAIVPPHFLLFFCCGPATSLAIP